jgi:hypothetical protein
MSDRSVLQPPATGSNANIPEPTPFPTRMGPIAPPSDREPTRGHHNNQGDHKEKAGVGNNKDTDRPVQAL